MTAHRRVLVVDDDEDCCELLVQLLVDDGYIASAHATVAAALAVLDQFDPDAVFVDIGLPDVDGLELVRELRKPSHRPRRIIVLTAHVSAAMRTRALEAGADTYLSKPTSLQSLRAALA